MAKQTDERLLLTVEEAAQRLNIGRTLVWQMVWQGALPSLRLGRCVRIPVRGLETWVAERTERVA